MCLLQVKEDDSGETLKRGTRVTLHLKEDAYELADEKKLGDLIKQYSEFIQFPIRQAGSSPGLFLLPSQGSNSRLARVGFDNSRLDAVSAALLVLVCMEANQLAVS